MEEAKKNIADVLVPAVLAVAIAPLFVGVAVFVQAFVLSTLWGWFMVPGFGARPLSRGLAIGLACVVSALVPSPPAPQGRRATRYLLESLVLTPALLLVIGWVAKAYLM